MLSSLGGRASCLRTALAPDTQVLVPRDPAQCHHAVIRHHAITHHMLQTHRSWRLAIRHHAVTRSDSGAQVARLSSRASCLCASPSLPLHMQRSGGQALACQRRHPFICSRLKSKSLAVGIRAIPPTSCVLPRTHRSFVRPLFASAATSWPPWCFRICTTIALDAQQRRHGGCSSVAT